MTHRGIGASGRHVIKIVFDDGRAIGQSIPTIDEPILKALVEAAHHRPA